MITIVMAWDENFSDMAAISVPLATKYCDKHGYALYTQMIDKREGDSCKIRIFRELYATGNFSGDDLFCWVDCDALVMDSGWTIEGIVGSPSIGMGEAHVLYGSDFNGLNTGVWFARFTSHADHFLRVSQQASWSMGWADQVGILQTWLQPIFHPWVKIVPGKRFNAMPYELYGCADWPHKNEINNYEEGDWICHFAGIEQERRLELMREYAKWAQ